MESLIISSFQIKLESRSVGFCGGRKTRELREKPFEQGWEPSSRNPCLDSWEQGWHSGESTRLPPVWPGLDSRTWCYMWVEFVVGSGPCSWGFSSGSPVFLPSQKSTLLNSNSIW